MTFDVNNPPNGTNSKAKPWHANLNQNWAEQKKTAGELQEELKLEFAGCEDALDFLINGFNWQATPQGEGYWQEVYENLGSLYNSVHIIKDL